MILRGAQPTTRPPPAFPRHSSAEDPARNFDFMTLVGKPIPRKEGRKKGTGQALYVDDLTFPGMLYGVTVRSSIPRGRIRNISFADGIPWNEFTIVTAKDIRHLNLGDNYVAL